MEDGLRMISWAEFFPANCLICWRLPQEKNMFLEEVLVGEGVTYERPRRCWSVPR